MNMPPISVVTTAGSGSTSRRPAKNNAPIILVKPPASKKETSIDSTSTTPAAPSDADLTASIAVINNDPLQSQSQSPPQASTEANDKQVDSALLSALRDKRERIALLRVEKNLIDFMNDKTCGYMEVGGQGNSIVIRGASGGGCGSSDGDVENSNGTTPTSRTQGNHGGDNSNAGGRQTSFQRLCLHRLADRFNIVREQGYHNPNNYANPNLGLIRLVKIKESRIPTVKLINLDLTHYDQTIPQDRNEGSGLVGVTDRLALTNLHDGGGGNGKKVKKKEKVKIMKRSSINSLAEENEKRDKANANKRKGKKLSDKEKAYAEARARIFNSNESKTNTPEGSEHADSETVISPMGSVEISASAHPIPSVTAAAQKATHLVPSQVSGSTGEQVVNASANRDSKRGFLPAAATGGAASKVLWRNREQEANDPDFQRRHHPSVMMPAHMQYHQYVPQNGMVQGNYHYGAVPEGQAYSQGAAYYSSGPPSRYQTDGSWQRHEHPPAAYEAHRQHQGSNGNETSPFQEGHNDSLARDINLSKDEFPALR